MRDEWHTVAADMSFKDCARGLGMDPRELLRLNTQIKGLQVDATLIRPPSPPPPAYPQRRSTHRAHAAAQVSSELLQGTRLLLRQSTHEAESSPRAEELPMLVPSSLRSMP